jgi:uncharacterized protein (UPF0297 family)
MDALLAKYSNIYCVNLVDNKGSEKKLAENYGSLCTKYNSKAVNYVHFDFHHECRGMKYENIQKLLDSIEKVISTFGYFSVNHKTGKIVSTQSGTIRTNCIDNLDRTNVVQSVFAKYYLNNILAKVEVIKTGDKFDSDAVFSSLYKTMWADHADRISTMYSGTGALKNDFTRYGKRTMGGLWSDFTNSVTRYYLNNFTDGKRQDSMNLFLGKYQVATNQASPFKGQGKGYFVPILGFFFFTGAFMGLSNLFMLFADPSEWKSRLYFFGGWALFSLLIYFVLTWNGKDLVDKPLLKSQKKHD